MKLYPLIFAAIFSACASTPERSLTEVKDLARSRTGLAAPPKEELAAVLARPLTADDAARVALANNAAFRMKLEEIGVAQAELNQAGLLENPRAHGALRMAGGGGGPEGHELGIKVNLLSLFELPLRRSVAANRLEQAKARLGHEILGLAAETRAAFYEHAASSQTLRLRRESVLSLEAAVALAEKQREAGNSTRLDLAVERAGRDEAKALLAREEARAAAARERLAMLLGLQDRDDWSVVPELPEPAVDEPPAQDVERAALAQRWDLQAARRDPKVLETLRTLEGTQLFGPVILGVDSEREYSGKTKYGPEFEIGVPLFDRRGVSRAAFAARRRQALASADALEAHVRYEARLASAELAASRKAAEAYKSALPHRRAVVEETLKNNNFMLMGVYQLLEAKRRELEASAAYVEALKDYWTRRAELERVAGGKLPEGGVR